MRFYKEKQVIKLCLRGSDAVITNSSNSSRLSFNFDGQFNHIQLSENAKIRIESINIPNLTNFSRGFISLECASETLFYDSKNKNSCYPVIGFVENNVYYNRFPFSKIHIPRNFLQSTMNIKIESISDTTVTFDNLTNFVICLLITDEELQQTHDHNLRPEVTFENAPRIKPGYINI